MRLIRAFLKLVRWPNLLFIILTQLLFYYCIYFPLYRVEKIPLLLWLIAASVFIAAAGYIINDYFDLNIDQINKPEKNVLNAIINRRWAIVWHLLFSFLGIAATILAVGLGKWYLIIANIICVALLWFYSTSFKRQLLIGNIVISLLAAWTVLILFFAQVPFNEAFNSKNDLTIKFFRLAFLYGGFAFVISLIREAIKDIEDREGDAQYGCRTLPVYAGTRATKIYISIWIVVLLAALIILQLYVLQFGWLFAVVYSITLIISPLFYLLIQVMKAQTVKEFARLSGLAKLIMLAGILSMVFFRLYF
jgi:4-hydroxybenzoate polyprenyltransferase